MTTLKTHLSIFLALAVCCASSGSYAQNHADFRVQVAEPAPDAVPTTIDSGNQRQLDELAGHLAEKRVVFIGEVHDRLSHHQNQLRIIQSMYARYPDLAIGVEYFQQPFQKYLDDYIAGRIDEREMLRKTEYFNRWRVDYRLIQPIFAYAREKHIPLLALNVSDEIHNKVFTGGMNSLNPLELAQTPKEIQPASEHYLQRLKKIFGSHPTHNEFGNFVEGVLLWDESMADTATRYLNSHPKSRMVVLAGMVHVMYGDGIPERVNHRLGSDQSTVIINGNDFGTYPGIADYQLLTEGGIELPKPGKLGVSIVDAANGVLISAFTPGSAAQKAGIAIGDRIVTLDGVKVTSILELKSLMFDKLPGERMQVVVERSLVADAREESRYVVELR